MVKISEIYDGLVTSGEIFRNEAQISVLPHLDALKTELEQPVKKSLFRKAPPPPKGLYIWGGVGTGKSFLMDLFAANVDVPARRVHFHAFMQEVQNALHIARAASEQDALNVVARNLSKGLRLLALDEMQIKDIADAMIVGRLFTLMREDGVVCVTTSNRPPDDLYKDGLNRQLFLPFIAYLKEHLIVHDMQSETDFRQNRMSGAQVYFTPLNSVSSQGVEELWRDLTGGRDIRHSLQVKGRSLDIPRYHNGVGRLSFYDLCGKPLGPADYLTLAEALRVIVIDDIPQLGRHNFNEAKRFVTLIDALYESKTRLICSAAALPEMLYLEGEGVFEFERTASRLREMQSADWTS
ncbi:MAG: cell division protein ZapE [Paracoccaceae bacterium]|jgi:cell division protein ZapE|nr:cell division protein ZapE [Pseudomonadota bacterium]MDA0849759.1 cell division protein ZapE [Pseudomonadota bacterium]MDA1296094.1 cell division protein ZapE [Pseudomonadota bacterium]